MKKQMIMNTKKTVTSLLLVLLSFTQLQAQSVVDFNKMANDNIAKVTRKGFGKSVNAAINKIFHKGNDGAQLPDSTLKSGSAYQVPSTISFDWEVVQQKSATKGDEKITYYFTTSGDWAAVKMGDKENSDLSLMIYAKDHATLMFDDKKKTITVMNMVKLVGDGAQLGKKIAESIKKKPLQPSNNKTDMTITKSGKTKMICGSSADEYLIKNEKGIFTVWYANVAFDPVKVYTMGVGRPADLSTFRNNPKMKNNMMALPVLNKNYLMAEMIADGKIGMETKSITKKSITISTAGYKIVDVSGKNLKGIIQDKAN